MATMSLTALLIALRAAHVAIRTDADGLRVDAPRAALTPELREAIRAHGEALKSLPRPHLNDRGELVIPLGAAPQYHWQPLRRTLAQLNAPASVLRRYVPQAQLRGEA